SNPSSPPIDWHDGLELALSLLAPLTRAGLPGVSPRGTADPPRPSRSSVAVRIARRKAPEGLGRSARRLTTSRAVAGGSLDWSRASERGPGKPALRNLRRLHLQPVLRPQDAPEGHEVIHHVIRLRVPRSRLEARRSPRPDRFHPERLRRGHVVA